MSYLHEATYVGQFEDKGRITPYFLVGDGFGGGNGRRSCKFEGSDR